MARIANQAVQRLLREDKLLVTVENIHGRIVGRFADSGLATISSEIVNITRDSLARAAAISRPNSWMRAGLGLLIVVAVSGIIVYAVTRTDKTPFWLEIYQFFDATKGAAAFLTATAIFLVTLETRLKRRRALQAVHELRALAHIIDMHQLTKNPDRLSRPADAFDHSEQAINASGMVRYLHYCTELLAVLGKIGQLYVQEFPDSTAESAVDHLEGLVTGLSGKIWQKLIVLDRIRRDDFLAASAAKK